MASEKIRSIKFSFFGEDEGKNLSEIEITSDLAFDELKNPVAGGLYDPAMGVSPHERFAKCRTCGNPELKCPGHMGRITLAVPVFNCFLLKDLLKLLRAKCYHCHRLTTSGHRLQDYRNIFQLLNMGLFGLYAEYSRLMVSVKKTVKKEDKREQKAEAKVETPADRKEQKAHGEEVQRRKKAIMEECRAADPATFDLQMTGFKQTKLAAKTKEFIRECSENRKCFVCKETKPIIKLESANRIRFAFSDKQVVSSTPLEIYEQIQHFEEVNRAAVNSIFANWELRDSIFSPSARDFRSFFLKTLLVTPNRFRPESKLGDQTFLHPHTLHYTKILSLNNEIKALLAQGRSDSAAEGTREKLVTSVLRKWAELQEAINQLLDSGSAGPGDDTGLRQLLEKKEGLFRMKMMGKRVDFAARSVISPDPFLRTDEVGLPLMAATKMTFPEPVNDANEELLRRCVINGAYKYPGAVAIEENGQMFFLEGASAEKRHAFANQLGVNASQKRVHRHVLDGDMVLFNRQPTLHKPSLLAFKVRVMPRELTVRMHYLNCSGFNADFDGDEMNVHLVQNHAARAEAALLALSDRHFVLPTNRQPVRGLIQDFIFAGVFLTSKDTVFERAEYCHLLATAARRLDSTKLIVLAPALRRPVELWTGKQLVSNLLLLAAKADVRAPGLCVDGQSRVPSATFCAASPEEARFRLRHNYVCSGLVDKNQIGASAFGLAHGFFELYGHRRAADLFSALTSLLLEFLRLRGYSVGIRDLLLTPAADRRREAQLAAIDAAAVEAQRVWLGTKKATDVPAATASRLSASPAAAAELDSVVKRALAPAQSRLFEGISSGLALSFPHNHFSAMVLTGAKGSTLNHSQVSINLGQQELEGRRVPTMATGRTLPCFAAFDPRPRCGGFIADRFLSGLHAPEFFFHCMAGREGLIDTAVKTSRSGYLQRTLMKNLESLVADYDFSVRDLADGALVQFAYGEDSLDSTKSAVLDNTSFFLDNLPFFKRDLDHNLFASPLPDIADPTRRAEKLAIETSARTALLPPARAAKLSSLLTSAATTEPALASRVYKALHQQALITPGESVGAVAAESFGEPSTQMTLNTFHLAGHGGANVTLGIPRLRELLSSKTVRAVVLSAPFKKHIPADRAKEIYRKLAGAKLIDLVRKVACKTEILVADKGELLRPELRKRLYKVVVTFEDLEAISEFFGLEEGPLESALLQKFVPRLNKTLAKSLRPAETGEPGDEAAKSRNSPVQGAQYVGGKLRLLVSATLQAKPIPIAAVVEDCLKAVDVGPMSFQGECHFLEDKEKDSRTLQSTSRDYETFWKLHEFLDLRKFASNDPNTFVQYYGIEATRNLLMKEISKVFSHYGIKVDSRHVSLVADYMSFEGCLRTLSRVGIQSSASPLLRMSFETTCKFLIDSCEKRETDNLRTPSARIVVGREILNGTGFFDVIT